MSNERRRPAEQTMRRLWDAEVLQTRGMALKRCSNIIWGSATRHKGASTREAGKLVPSSATDTLILILALQFDRFAL